MSDFLGQGINQEADREYRSSNPYARVDSALDGGDREGRETITDDNIFNKKIPDIPRDSNPYARQSTSGVNLSGMGAQDQMQVVGHGASPKSGDGGFDYVDEPQPKGSGFDIFGGPSEPA